MTRFLDNLNLRPQERKLVVFVMIVVFVALNWFFVRPYFGELGRTQQRIIDADKSIKTFTEEIQRKPFYQKQKDQLAQKGGQVPSEEQATALAREVGNQAGAAGVNPTSTTLVPRGRGEGGRTNAFFEEQAVNLTFANTGESELVNFLFGLASQNSLIRVKSMTLRPDPGGMRLGGTLTLVESFQKKPQAKGAATTPPAPAPAVAARPATPPKTSNTPPKTAAPPPKSPPAKTSAPAPATMKTNFPPKRMLPGAPPAPK